jgi:hypothetical protein
MSEKLKFSTTRITVIEPGQATALYKADEFIQKESVQVVDAIIFVDGSIGGKPTVMFVGEMFNGKKIAFEMNANIFEGVNGALQGVRARYNKY